MRHFGFLSIATLAFLGGCVLAGTYEYGDYGDEPTNTGGNGSVSSGGGSGGGSLGDAGMGGMDCTGGSAGMGGGSTSTPDICDDGQVEGPCSQPDCTLKAQISKT